MMKNWPASGSKARVVHMSSGDFFESETSATMAAANAVLIKFVSADGLETVLREEISLLEGEVIDAAVMHVANLRAFYAEQIAAAKRDDVLLSLHLKATMMKVSDPIMFGHCVSVYFKDALEKHADTIDQI
jgi:isocitrate dehydrogenase